MTIVHEFHGGIQDGLRIPQAELHTTVALPTDRVISNATDYEKWEPTEGQVVDVFILRGTPTRAEGAKWWVHHLYKDHQEILRVRPT